MMQYDHDNSSASRYWDGHFIIIISDVSVYYKSMDGMSLSC